MQGPLSPLPDWNGGVPTDPSPQVWHTNFYPCSAPHVLSINQKNERASSSKLLRTALMEQTAGGFQLIITGDEWWLFFYYLRDLV
jgi:hypothetical protein